MRFLRGGLDVGGLPRIGVGRSSLGSLPAHTCADNTCLYTCFTRVCMRVYTYTCAHCRCVHPNMCVCVCTCPTTCPTTSLCISLHTCLFIQCLYTCRWTWLHAWLRIHSYTCPCTCLHTCLHTSTHKSLQMPHTQVYFWIAFLISIRSSLRPAACWFSGGANAEYVRRASWFRCSCSSLPSPV